MELYRDHFQNYKRYNIPKAQLIIADIPYNIGVNAYASSPSWYKDGDNKNGESNLAKTTFFDTDNDFRIPEFMHFVSTMLKKEPKETGQAGCMIVFCEFEQQCMLIEEGKKYGFNHYINLVFRKNYSAQVLKANMKVVGNCEYAVLLYREKLPKFNNFGQMIFNCMDYQRDNETPKIHPTQKSIHVIKNLISVFTDIGDVVIDPTAGSGVVLLASEQLGRKSYGFEIKKEFVEGFNSKLAQNIQSSIFQQELIQRQTQRQLSISDLAVCERS
jgi:site-specific DNA-methyltransferase (adenine-specific)